MNSKKRLSIIVPVYNVESYLPKCLDSLLLQDIQKYEYEIIIINDGSNDNSEEVVRLYLYKNFNIRYIKQKNQGLGGARNTGILNACGKYLMFVDSDDYIEKKCLAMLLDKAEKNDLDVLRYNYEDVDENYRIIPKRRSAKYAVFFKDDIIDGKKFLSERLGWACYAWSYLYKTSLLSDGKILFEKNIYYEDTEWLPRFLLTVKRVGSINKHIYNYVERSGSITNSTEKWKLEKTITDKIDIIDKLNKNFSIIDDPNVELWLKGVKSLTVISILSTISNYHPNEKNKIISLMKDRRLFPLGIYRFTLKQIRDVFIINLNPNLYCYFKKIGSSIKG